MDTLKSRNNLAINYADVGRLKEAIALYEPTLKVYEAKLGRDQPLTRMCRHNLANAYEFSGRLADGIALHEENVKLNERRGARTTRTRSMHATAWRLPTTAPAGMPTPSRFTS